MKKEERPHRVFVHKHILLLARCRSSPPVDRSSIRPGERFDETEPFLAAVRSHDTLPPRRSWRILGLCFLWRGCRSCILFTSRGSRFSRRLRPDGTYSSQRAVEGCFFLLLRWVSILSLELEVGGLQYSSREAIAESTCCFRLSSSWFLESSVQPLRRNVGRNIRQENPLQQRRV